MEVYYGPSAYLKTLVGASTVEEVEYEPQVTDNTISLVADGVIIGYILYTPGDPIYIDYVAVHPHYARKGICQRLVALLISLHPEASSFYLENVAGYAGCRCYLKAFYAHGYQLTGFTEPPDCEGLIDMLFVRT